jgi:hypothetical protein
MLVTLKISPGACIIKLIIVIINSVTYKASVFIKAGKKSLPKAKALAYCTTEVIMAIESFIIQAPMASLIKL